MCDIFQKSFWAENLGVTASLLFHGKTDNLLAKAFTTSQMDNFLTLSIMGLFGASHRGSEQKDPSF